jgi:hypothetical protein
MTRNRILRFARPAGLALAALLVLASAAAGLGVWTLTGVPLTATQYSVTSFTLTLTDLSLLDEIGCVQIDTTSAFSVSSVAVGNASTGRRWLGSYTGTQVIVRSQDGGGRLGLGDSLVFEVDATPLTSGLHTWSAVAYRQQDCSGSALLGVPLVTITVLAGSPTPSPQPTSTAQATSTPQPTSALTATPTPSARPFGSSPASPLPSASPSSLGQSSAPPSSSPVASGTLSSPPSQISGGAGPGSSPASGPLPPGVAGSNAGAEVPTGNGLEVRRPGGDGLTVDGVGTTLGAGGFIVPVTVFGVPGLLILLWVGLQVAGGLVWLPAARRVREDDETRRPGGTA